MQDVKSAEMLVHEADLILQKQDDPGAYGTRQKLLEGLEARSLPELDRTGLFLQLGALRGQTGQPSALAPEFVNGEALPENAQDSRWQRWLNELTRYVRVDFDASADVKPLLAGQTLGQVRLALSLASSRRNGPCSMATPGLSAVAGAGEHTARRSFQR